MKFKMIMSTLKSCKSHNGNFVLYIILIIISVIASFFIPLFNSGLIAALVAKHYNSPAREYLYAIAFTWLGTFSVVSLLFLASVEF